MQKNIFKQNHKTFNTLLLIFLIFSLGTIIVTFPLILRMNTGIYGPFFNTDLRGAAWEWWWFDYSFTHHLNYNFCTFINAPFGIDRSLQSVNLVSGNISKSLAIVANFPLGFNIITLVSFALTGVLMFLLADYFVKNKIIAVFCGLIFTFSPYHLNKTMEFCYMFHGGWLSLYVLNLLKLKDEISLKRVIFASVALALILDSNPYYGFFALIFTLGLGIFCIFYEWRNKIKLLFTKREVLGERFFSGFRLFSIFMVVFFISAILNFSFIYPHIKMIFFSKSLAGASGNINTEYVRSFDYLISQSARPLSYLLPASTHPIFGNFTKSMFGSIFYGRGSNEQTLYLGWAPLILAFVAFRQWKKKRLHPNQHPDYLSSSENFYIGFFIFSAWLAFLFSMPPIVDLGLFKLYFPSYFTYKILPMFRAYARFGVIVMLCVSVLAGFGIKFILEKIRSRKVKSLFLTFIFFTIIFEFTNMPPTRVADLTKVPEVYTWLKHQPGDFIIAEYPMTKSSPGEAWCNYDYLYYQTKHQKRMINGVMPGTRAFDIKMKILRVADPLTPRILKSLGIKYIILHSDLYAESSHPGSVDIEGEIPQLEKIKGYSLIKTFGNESVYEVNAEPVKLDSLLNDNGGGRAKNN